MKGVGLAVAAMVAAVGVHGKPAGTFAGCPKGLLPPPLTYTTEARHAATVFLHTTYAEWNREHHWGMRLAGAQVGEPLLVRRWLPSGWVRDECGKLVWLSSVVVPVGFPAMAYPNPIGPCNACAHVAFLLGKTRRGWVTWGSY